MVNEESEHDDNAEKYGWKVGAGQVEHVDPLKNDSNLKKKQVNDLYYLACVLVHCLSRCVRRPCQNNGI